ncbi:hypothetical protein HDU81_001244 [Chytriomyces hyalinus]|nr:hypothetical protein HDU81_001244 [Chytriomyces hyalinus]
MKQTHTGPLLLALFCLVFQLSFQASSAQRTTTQQTNNASVPCVFNNNAQPGAIFILTPNANNILNSAAVVGGKLNVTWSYSDTSVIPNALTIYWAYVPTSNGLTPTQAPTPQKFHENAIATNIPGNSRSYIWQVGSLQPGNYLLRIVADDIDPQYYMAVNPGKVQCYKAGQPFPGTSMTAFAIAGNSQLVAYSDNFGPSNSGGKLMVGLACSLAWILLVLLHCLQIIRRDSYSSQQASHGGDAFKHTQSVGKNSAAGNRSLRAGLHVPVATESGSLRPGGAGNVKSNISLATSRISLASKAILHAAAVEYEEKDASYFEKRQLPKSDLGYFDLFVVTYAVLASGTGYGWWTYCTANGWGTLLVATAVMTIWQMSFGVILTELMTMLPFIGGLATYSRAAFGPYIGYLIAQCELAEYTIFISANLNGVAVGFVELTGMDKKYVPLWWFIVFILMLALMLMKSRFFFTTFAILTTASILINLSLVLPQLGQANPILWAETDFFNQTYNGNVTETGFTPFNLETALFPIGFTGFMKTLPYIFGDFQGLEIMPLLAEESKNFVKDGPRAMMTTIIFFNAMYWMLVLVVPSLPPGLYVTQWSWDPVVDTFVYMLQLEPEGSAHTTLSAVFPLISGQIACVLSLTLAFTRLNFAMSRSGLMPQYLSLTHFPFKAEPFPWAAFLFSIVTTMMVILITYFAEASQNLEQIIEGLGPAGFFYLSIMCT